jgi:hypothetical protein
MDMAEVVSAMGPKAVQLPQKTSGSKSSPALKARHSS